MTTRAMSESAPTEAEKKISTVYLFAYDGATANAEPVQVFELKNGVAGANGYTKYTISNLKKDKNYFFYVVANIFDSDEESALKSSYPSKGNLAGKILDYTTDMFAYPNTTAGAANGLPMSCDNGNIYYYGDNSEKKYFNSNQAQLFDGSKTLYADLVFCVAKVTVNVEKPAGDYCALTEANLFNYAKTFPILATSSELATSGTAGLQLKGNNLKGTDHTYTFYVPENTFSKRAESKLNIKFKDENDTELTVDIPLGEKDGNNVRTLDRGCHYEYLLNSKGNITLNVYS
ncbi:MAG: hypothetical protein K2J87_01725, partial [Muribaculaceae bacterium]|nr:hypothetical protein [Muribaculaceae bacterium]